jgi:hypothetical protein
MNKEKSADYHLGLSSKQIKEKTDEAKDLVCCP